MKKNIGSQIIGVQMVSATDGSAFTGSVTVVITGDGGMQGASGGTGPTHEGNGYHTYIPTKAETNYDLIGFTFTGSGAVPVTVQVFTTFPQTADAPTAAAVRTEIDSNSTQLAVIVLDTGTTIPSQLTDAFDIIVGAAGAKLDVGTGAGQVQVSNGIVESNLMEIRASSAAAMSFEDAYDGTGFDVGGIDVSVLNAAATAIGSDGTGLTEAGGTGDQLTAINLPDQTMDIAGNITGNLSGSVGTVTSIPDGAIGAAAVADIFSTTALTEAYAADGAAGTPAQLLYLIQQAVTEFAFLSTTKTIKKLDGSNTAATMTLDDAANPTSSTRAT